MTSEALANILTKYGKGVSTGDAGIDLPPDSEATLFATLGDETVAIERVRNVLFEPSLLIATTAREERFVLLFEDIRAVRFHGTASQGAGYGTP